MWPPRLSSPLQRRPGDALAHQQHVRQVQGEVPAGVVLPVALDGQAGDPLLERLDPLERLLHLRRGADDADQVVHRLLQVVLHGVGVLAAVPLERRERGAAGVGQRLVRQRRPGPDCGARARRRPTPARRPNTSRSDSELPPSRLDPCMPPATSPAANRPGMRAASVSGSTSTPPIT